MLSNVKALCVDPGELRAFRPRNRSVFGIDAIPASRPRLIDVHMICARASYLTGLDDGGFVAAAAPGIQHNLIIDHRVGTILDGDFEFHALR